MIIKFCILKNTPSTHAIAITEESHEAVEASTSRSSTNTFRPPNLNETPYKKKLQVRTVHIFFKLKPFLINDHSAAAAFFFFLGDASSSSLVFRLAFRRLFISGTVSPAASFFANSWYASSSDLSRWLNIGRSIELLLLRLNY